MKQVINQKKEQVSTLQDQLIQKENLIFEIEDAKEKLQDQYDKALKEPVCKFVVNEASFIIWDQIFTDIYEAWTIYL